MWVRFKLCRYKFIMVTRTAQNHVKETPTVSSLTKQLYHVVSIEWLPCLCTDAANHHEVCKKYCNYLGRDSNLEFALPFAIRVSLELSCQAKGDLALQCQRPSMQIQSASKCFIYIYTYIIFAIDVYLCSTYIIIYT